MPPQKTIMRNPDCPKYDDCLKYAAKRDLEFVCDVCRVYPEEEVKARLEELMFERLRLDKKIQLLEQYLRVGK